MASVLLRCISGVFLSPSFVRIKAQGSIVRKLEQMSRTVWDVGEEAATYLEGTGPCKPHPEFVLGQWGSIPDHDVAVHWDSLFWLICFEVVTLGLSLFLQNWEIILSPGFWIEWSHRQVARIITWGVGENWGRGLGEEVVGDSTGLWVMLLLASRVLQRV